ncbi:MAG: transcription-repair coupling factor [Candidatus Aceula meridiana]|nr:transcription-repair coupling factor [Candidatus Aceula meridiana]
MFRSLKFFVAQTVSSETILKNLVAFGYTHVDAILEEGDFCKRGGIIDIFPTNFDSPVRIDLDDDKIRSIASYNLTTGKSIWQHHIVIILPKRKSKKDNFSSETPLNNFVDVAQGDYVVHNNHGIGKFLGIEERVFKDEKKEHLVLEYANGDKLFVPKNDIHLVQKYVGFTKKPPRLYRLGSGKWKKIRARIQKRIQQFAAELLHIQALRASLEGFSFDKNNSWQKEFEKNFSFKETPDQKRAWQEVKADMESKYPMDRLICGDVGYGKTEVAMRAAFKAVMNNKQVAILVPTTILAEQHYYNFLKRVKQFPVEIAMLNRFRTPKEQTEIIKSLAKGGVDIIIGTHRLLSDDIIFKDLGLVIIDEEQRFGVKAKEKLKRYRLLVDVLTLTATPIPRTLYMAITGARDMSAINTPPQNRIPVSTHLIEFDEDIIKDAISRELRRKGQTFFLHNRVEDIDKIGNIIKKLVPRAQVCVAHGQMPGRLLERIMLQFLKGDIDILVCTTIIESGIDIPNANTLLVNRADRFGLADLHQLRGRVGRFTNKAYSYFITPPKNAISPQAKSRLEAIAKYSGLGAGFNIAFEDLQIRGGGNLLGEQQHGYISSVGFDLYCRLLKESVENLRNAHKGDTE